MKKGERARVKALMKELIKPADKIYYWSSYSLKGEFERIAECYISNQEFKELMIELGHRPTKRTQNEVNHKYRIQVTPDDRISIYFKGYGCQRKYF